jgi:hypothetical protein
MGKSETGWAAIFLDGLLTWMDYMTWQLCLCDDIFGRWDGLSGSFDASRAICDFGITTGVVLAELWWGTSSNFSFMNEEFHSLLH